MSQIVCQHRKGGIMETNQGEVRAFLIMSFVISWVLYGAFLVFGGKSGTGAAGFIAFFGSIVPGIVVIIVRKFLGNGRLKSPLALYFKPNRWFFFAWLMGLVVTLAIAQLGVELPGHRYSPDMADFYSRMELTKSAEEVATMKQGLSQLPISLVWITVITGMIGGVTYLMLLSLMSEMAWRGFLLPVFSKFGFWKAALLTGGIWGLWSMPVVFVADIYPEGRLAGMGMMLVYCILMSPIVSYFRAKSGSVLPSSIFLGTAAGLAAIPLMIVEGSTAFTVGLTGLAGFIVLGAVDVLLVVYDRFVADTPVAETAVWERPLNA